MHAASCRSCWLRRRSRCCKGRCRHHLCRSSVVRWREARASSAWWASWRSTGSSDLPSGPFQPEEARSRNPRRQRPPSHRGLDRRRLFGSPQPKGGPLHSSGPGNRRDFLDLLELGRGSNVAPARAHRVGGYRFIARPAQGGSAPDLSSSKKRGYYAPVIVNSSATPGRRLSPAAAGIISFLGNPIINGQISLPAAAGEAPRS